jgi:hypothetical protein
MNVRHRGIQAAGNVRMAGTDARANYSPVPPRLALDQPFFANFVKKITNPLA